MNLQREPILRTASFQTTSLWNEFFCGFSQDLEFVVIYNRPRKLMWTQRNLRDTGLTNRSSDFNSVHSAESHGILRCADSRQSMNMGKGREKAIKRGREEGRQRKKERDREREAGGGREERRESVLPFFGYFKCPQQPRQEQA